MSTHSWFGIVPGNGFLVISVFLMVQIVQGGRVQRMGMCLAAEEVRITSRWLRW